MEISAPVLDDPALEAYEALAPFYDLFTDGYSYDTLLAELERLALDHGLAGRRLLDVGCGTGKSFLPMLARGYEVAGCDLSPAMVELAREKLPPGLVDLFVADMRDLPPAGPFDLITCLDDAINYLVDPGDLVPALSGMAANLAPGGLVVFDVNTLSTYRGVFSGQGVRESDDVVFCWRGRAGEDWEPGAALSAQLDVFTRAGRRRLGAGHRPPPPAPPAPGGAGGRPARGGPAAARRARRGRRRSPRSRSRRGPPREADLPGPSGGRSALRRPPGGEHMIIQF